MHRSRTPGSGTPQRGGCQSITILGATKKLRLSVRTNRYDGGRNSSSATMLIKSYGRASWGRRLTSSGGTAPAHACQTVPRPGPSFLRRRMQRREDYSCSRQESGSEPWAKILDYAQPATRQITDRSIHNGWFSPSLRAQAPGPLRLPYAVGCLGHPSTAWVSWAF